MTNDQPWWERTACTTEDGDADIFDYDPHRPHNRARAEGYEYAKAICRSCPVIDSCLEEAIEQEAGASVQNRYEIRGGLTPEERAALDPNAGKRTPSRMPA